MLKAMQTMRKRRAGVGMYTSDEVVQLMICFTQFELSRLTTR